MAWIDDLQPASWRGIPFVVEQSGDAPGRRVILHEYPYRAFPWPEDMGPATQRINFSGFLVGDDVMFQRDAMRAACNQPGPGILVHPTLGPLTAVCISPDFAERKERGRVIEVRFSFVITGDAYQTLQSGPFVTASTVQASLNAVSDAVSAIRAGYYAVMSTALAIVGTAEFVVGTVTDFVNLVTSIGPDAACILNSINGIDALTNGTSLGQNYSLSRYVSGNTDGNQNAIISGVNHALAPADLIATATQALLDNTVNMRAALNTAIAAAISTASTNPNDPTGIFLTSVQAVTEALRASINDPADQSRLLSQLASYQGQPISSAYSTTQSTINDTVAAACRRAALFSLAVATSKYQLTTTEDVLALIDLIVPLYQAEIEYAADANDGATYNALIILLAAIVADLQARGANLPSIVTITNLVNYPAFVVAYNLYQDATRETQVIALADPIHPLFMALSFEALSS